MGIAQPIRFFRKNKADFSYTGVTAYASQAQDQAQFPRNRSNRRAWMTSGSVDADNTTYEMDFGDARHFDSLILLLHNFKNFKVEWFDGVNYQNFSPAINVTDNANESSFFQFADTLTAKIKITIFGTIEPDADKFLFQFIATEQLGQLEGWPVIKAPVHIRNRIINKMQSGKITVNESVGGFKCELTVSNWRSDVDLSLIEQLYDQLDGFLVWLSGGSDAQFSSRRHGYRLEDIYLMKIVNDYSPEFVKGLYSSGLAIKVQLQEAVA